MEPKFKTPNEIFRAAADAVRAADPKTLVANVMMSNEGCMCAAGQVAYLNDPQMKKAVDGFRLLREAKILDEDLIDIIADAVNRQCYWTYRELVADSTSRFDVYFAHDTIFSQTRNPEYAAQALEALIQPEEELPKYAA